MTYEEAYMKCETLEELENEIKKDVSIAMLINPDRLKVIKEVGERVANLKFKWKDYFIARRN